MCMAITNQITCHSVADFSSVPMRSINVSRANVSRISFITIYPYDHTVKNTRQRDMSNSDNFFGILKCPFFDRFTVTT